MTTATAAAPAVATLPSETVPCTLRESLVYCVVRGKRPVRGSRIVPRPWMTRRRLQCRGRLYGSR